MESEDGDYAEIVAEVMRKFERVVMEREEAQRAIERVVERVGRFNGDKVPFYLEAYNAEMEAQEVDAALRLEFFGRVATPRIYAEVKELAEALYSWEVFGEALWQTYGDPPRSRNRRNFDHWVASAKTHHGAVKAFQEFGRRFARLPVREQRLVGADKVLLFVRSIDRAERRNRA